MKPVEGLGQFLVVVLVLGLRERRQRLRWRL
jgi:hypothetical protein